MGFEFQDIFQIHCCYLSNFLYVCHIGAEFFYKLVILVLSTAIKIVNLSFTDEDPCIKLSVKCNNIFIKVKFKYSQICINSKSALGRIFLQSIEKSIDNLCYSHGICLT